MPGPLPKSQHQRESDTRRRITDRQVTVTRDGSEHGPSLAEATGRDDWGPQTRRYWQVWRTSPQAQAFEDTDWQRLAMMVPLYELYWLGVPDKGIAAEIRLNEERLGATVADRQRLRMKIEDATDAEIFDLGGESDEDLRA